jgi:hypothetical protein
MKVKRSQGRKEMCSRCSYKMKKIRSSEKYWGKKDKKSTRYQYWKGRLVEIERLKNKK